MLNPICSKCVWKLHPKLFSFFKKPLFKVDSSIKIILTPLKLRKKPICNFAYGDSNKIRPNFIGIQHENVPKKAWKLISIYEVGQKIII